MDPEKCDKRQREERTSRDGQKTEQFRCMDKRALDTHLQIVDVPTCEGCPLLAAKLDREKGCGGVANPQHQGHWMDQLLSVETVARDMEPGKNVYDANLGYEQPCHHRWDGKCRITNHTVDPAICKACDQETADHMATLPEMGVGFAAEVRMWIREGRPVRSDEEVKHILETFCKKCDLYDSVKEACKKCGCAMNDKSWALRNGIKMKTKICPMGLWR